MKTLLYVTRVFSLAVAGFATIWVLGCVPNGSGGDEGGTHVDIETPPSYDPAQTVCDPFSAGSSFPTRGLVGRLFYLDDSQPRYTTVGDYITNGHEVDANLFFNRLNVPTRPFDRGFTLGNGLTVVDQTGDVLYEYFALQLYSKIKLAPGEEPGPYQFAILADDGAVLKNRDTGEVIVNDDGTHPTRMACATSPVYMDSLSELPVEITYYQGPRFHISLMVLWRPYPGIPENVNDPLCGRQGNSFFFDSTQTPPAPSANYYALLERGWKVLDTGNLKLPTEGSNPCAPAEDPMEIFNFTLSGVTSSGVVASWNTNINANSKVEYKRTTPGAPWTVLPIDEANVMAHSMSISGLLANTVYVVRVTSTSPGGQTIVSDEKAFRTATP